MFPLFTKPDCWCLAGCFKVVELKLQPLGKDTDGDFALFSELLWTECQVHFLILLNNEIKN